MLYVGTSRDLRTRVRSYFTASETRSRMGEMVALASKVTAIECATPLEAEVRELRLIALHKPRYNRRSRFPEKVHWIKLTDEPWPRLSLVRQVLDDADDGADYLGPFPSRKAAEKCLAALHEAFPVRQCSGRLPLLPSRSPCVLAEMDRCLSPCDGSVEPDTYAAMVGDLRDNLVHRADEVVEALTGRMATLALGERYEEATVHRDRLAAFVRAAARMQRLSSLIECRHLVAARPAADRPRHWELAVIRSGRLAATAVMPADAAPATFVAALVASAETVEPGPGPLPAALAEETEVILRWLDQPGTRLVELDGQWAVPLHGAESVKERIDTAYGYDGPLAEKGLRRDLRPMHRPAR